VQATLAPDSEPWDSEPTDVEQSDVQLPEPINPVGPWQTKIKFNFEACKKWGMRDKFIKLLAKGADLSLFQVPPPSPVIGNYSSLLEHDDLSSIEKQLWGMVDSKFLELVDRPGLGFVPLGLVPKPPPPPDPVTGEFDTKSSGMRIISDLSASGLNACIRDIPMRLPTPRDVVRRM
jgi:hypothetical protein